MNIKFLFLSIALILMLPHCTKVRPKKTFEPIQEQTEKRIGILPSWDNVYGIMPIPLMQDITMNDAITIGIDHNPQLQAHFEEIGIKKADLVQAGFYTNPQLSSIFGIPKQDGLQTSIEITAQVTLSDLWQVPRRKKVAQKSLEVKTYEIITEILRLRKDIQLRYLACVYNRQHLELIKEITSLIQAMKERIDYRYQFGYNSDLDRYFVSIKLAEWQALIIDAETKLRNSYIELHEILGTPISSKKLNLTDMFYTPTLQASHNELENFGVTSHPLILVEETKIARAKASISYEKSRIGGDVNIGIAYQRELEKHQTGLGPSLTVNIPIFDTNYGNIERAKFELNQAQKALLAQQRMVITAIARHFFLYSSYIDQIELYKKQIAPLAVKAIAFNKEFFERMQMNMITFLETQISVAQTKIMLLELTYKAAQEYIELEFAAGSQLNNLV